MTDPRLIHLRMELYAAAQTLKGEDLEEFWKLIDEIVSIRPSIEKPPVGVQNECPFWKCGWRVLSSDEELTKRALEDHIKKDHPLRELRIDVMKKPRKEE